MKVLLILLGVLGSAWWLYSHESHSGVWGAPEAQVSYYGNGQARSKLSYADGRPQGPAEEWYPDGTPASRGRYDHGERVGEWTFWLQDGSIDRERSGRYVDGHKLDPAQERADS